MSSESRFPPLDLQSAAAVLGLPSPAVDALVGGGYLAAHLATDGSLRFNATDLKSFVARNADNGSGDRLLDRALSAADPGANPVAGRGGGRQLTGLVTDSAGRDGEPGDGTEATDMRPEELLRLLDERAELMARRVLMMFATVFPDAAAWTPEEQSRFVERARSRFESVLAVVAVGDQIDDSVYRDLRRIGAAAARSSTDLRQTLFLLRMSRDLVVQNAVELAGSSGGSSSYALSLLLTRILPAMDRLSDAVSGGYWEALFKS